MSLATEYKYKDIQRTDWHRLTFFGRLVDIVEEFVKKGDRLYVEGRVEYSTTEGSDGIKRYWTDVVVNDLIMLGDTRSETAKAAAEDDAPWA